MRFALNPTSIWLSFERNYFVNRWSYFCAPDKALHSKEWASDALIVFCFSVRSCVRSFSPLLFPTPLDCVKTMFRFSISFPSRFSNRHTKLHYAQYVVTIALIASHDFLFSRFLQRSLESSPMSCVELEYRRRSRFGNELVLYQRHDIYCTPQ